MPIKQNPDQIYAIGDSIGWTFGPAKFRGVEASHGYETGCPQQATDSTKANGTVTIYVRTDNDDYDPGDVMEEAGEPLLNLPVTALVDDGTSLEFTLYEPLDEALKYQMKALINWPDPDNPEEVLEFTVIENFTIKDQSV
jgi:hypothetical protein